MINVKKKSWHRIEFAALDKLIYSYVALREQGRKLPEHLRMTHMGKIDKFTGHEESSNLHFILKIIFHCIFTEKPYIFKNLYS